MKYAREKILLFKNELTREKNRFGEIFGYRFAELLQFFYQINQVNSDIPHTSLNSWQTPQNF